MNLIEITAIYWYILKLLHLPYYKWYFRSFYIAIRCKNFYKTGPTDQNLSFIPLRFHVVNPKRGFSKMFKKRRASLFHPICCDSILSVGFSVHFHFCNCSVRVRSICQPCRGMWWCRFIIVITSTPEEGRNTVKL